MSGPSPADVVAATSPHPARVTRHGWQRLGCRPLAVVLSVLLCLAGLAPVTRAAPPDELFLALADAPDPMTAATIEQQIWEQWMAGPEPPARELLARARDAATGGDLAGATALFDELVLRYPDYAEGYNQRAILHYLTGDLEASLADIERTLALEPRHFGALAGRGQCYLRLDRPLEALHAFEASLTLNPWSRDVQQQVQQLRLRIEQQSTPI